MACSTGRVLGLWLGGIGLFLLGVLGIIFSGTFIKHEIEQRVVLTPGSDSYGEWQEPDMPIFLQVYPFNVTNPEQVEAGTHKPDLQQLGPYTYREHIVKYNISHNSNGTVTYKQSKTYDFIANMSSGLESDFFTSINIPLLTLVEALRWKDGLSGRLITFIANLLNKYEDETLFITRNVSDLVWGYHDPLLSLGQTFDKTRFYTDFVGVLMNKNNTYDGVYTVYTGEDDISLLGSIDLFNGSKFLPYWTSDTANMVNGSDGTVFSPFVSKKDTIRMFLSDICRSVYVLYDDIVYGKDSIPLYRFRAPRSSLESADINPDNAGFCTPAGNCMGTGVLNISSCQTVDYFHIPIVISYPHFYLADEKYRDAVNGMAPVQDWHSTDVDIEPNTGILMKVAKRMQININLAPLEGITQVKNVKNLVLPILWINESMVIDDAHANMVKNELLIPKMAVNILMYVVATVGGLMVLLAMAFGTTTCTSTTYVKMDEEDADDDDGNDDAEIKADDGTSPESHEGAESSTTVHPDDTLVAVDIHNSQTQPEVSDTLLSSNGNVPSDRGDGNIQAGDACNEGAGPQNPADELGDDTTNEGDVGNIHHDPDSIYPKLSIEQPSSTINENATSGDSSKVVDVDTTENMDSGLDSLTVSSDQAAVDSGVC